MLMLLGVMYCRSNRKQRAEKFYELVEIELTDNLSVNDPELKDYVPFLYEIVYKFMFRLYDQHHDANKLASDKKTQLQPDMSIEQYVPDTEDLDGQVKDNFEKKFLTNVFGGGSRMDKAEFEKKLSGDKY